MKQYLYVNKNEGYIPKKVNVLDRSNAFDMTKVSQFFFSYFVALKF